MESSAVPATYQFEWTDPKRYLWLLGLVVPLLPFIAWGLVELTGLGLMWWSGPFVVFVVIPFLDRAIGKDSSNPPDSVLRRLEEDRYYRWCTYVFIPIQYAALVFACTRWASGHLSVADDLGLALTVAMVGGIAINTAHELGHKRPQHEKWLAKVALAQSGYGHFFIEHNRGHHVRVATPEDPASARLGESFWEFLPRTVWGSLKSAVHLERQRLGRAEKPFVTPQNDILNAWAMSVVLFVVLIAVFGWSVAPWLAVQAVIAFSLLEVVNYLEHYGLLRQKLEDGRYERCRPEHSWNSDNIASNIFLYHLQRHSDHHAHPTRRYQALRHFENLPELPSGYASMILLAYATPLWFRHIDPMVVRHYGGDVAKANILPRKRSKILSRWSAGSAAGTAVPAKAAGRVAPASSDAHAYRCPDCGYVYEAARGHPREGFPPGTPWSKVPTDWSCPDCGVRDKVDFVPVELVTARCSSDAAVSATTGSGSPSLAAMTRGLIRDRVLDAVGELLRDRSWAQVTMSEVADQAGVSRQTLYNAFGSRLQLAEAYVAREAGLFLAAVDIAVREHSAEPRRALAAALEIFLTAAGRHPLVRAITSTDGGDEGLPLVTTRGGPLLDRATAHLTDLLIDTWPQLRPAQARPVADALVRLAISYAALPGGEPAATAATIAEILGPSIDEAMAE